MIPHTTFLHTTELEGIVSLCFRAFDGSNYDVRCAVGKALGTLLSHTLIPAKSRPGGGKLCFDISLKVYFTYMFCCS